MKKCKIIKTENGFTVRETNFLHYSDAEMYAYCLANTLNNGGKLIYVENVDAAIKKHNQLEGMFLDDWLRLCWNRNAGCYLHTKNVYALKDNSLLGNKHQWYKDANQWWDYMPVETKALISGIDNQNASDYHYRAFWAKMQPSDKDCIYLYWKHRNGKITLDSEHANSLQMEIISELAEIQLATEYNISSADMYDENGSFHKEYQDRFNCIYDDIETRLSDNQI